MVRAAKKAGVPLAEIAARQLRDFPSAAKEFIILSGGLPEKNPTKLGAQAGALIYKAPATLGEAMQAIKGRPSKNIQSAPWYKFYKADPAGFLAACIIYEETASNFMGRAVVLNEAASYADGTAGKTISPVKSTDKGSGIDLSALAGSGNTNALDAGISLALATFGIPIPPGLVHKLGDFAGDLVGSMGVGENGRNLPGGWIEYWKYFKNQPKYKQPIENTPVSVGYWRTTWYPRVADEMRQGGFNPPPNPAKGDEAAIQDATIFLAAMNELFIKYASQVQDMTNGFPAVWAKIKELALKDGLQIPDAGKAKEALAAGFMPSGSGSGELPEIGTVKTPFGNISWGLTNNKAMITYIAIAALAIVAIVYFTRKKS